MKLKRGFTDKFVVAITVAYFIVVVVCLVQWYINQTAPVEVLENISGVFGFIFVSNVAKNGYENGVSIKSKRGGEIE